MISFECDYNNGAHPSILKRLVETNDKQSGVYGFDEYSDSAKEKIKNACEDKDAEVFFLTGGTQTNSTVIDSVLENYEGVIAIESGHINVHEVGAIEFTGHKVITLPQHDGKMTAKDLNDYMISFNANSSDGHSVFPGMVYISFPSEYGTIYSAHELDDIYNVCKEYKLPLFIDGARLGYGIMATDGDVSLPYIAHHCDVFYIGGTKVGALCGEAVVFTHNNACRHFFSIQKQHGALMAKGRLLGIQFDTLFTDGLYFDISKHAIEMVVKMKNLFINKGYHFYIESPTNQQFVIISNDLVKKLSQKVEFSHWGPADANNTICRFVTSWATTDDDIKELDNILPSI